MITIQWKAELNDFWWTIKVVEVPVSRPVKIHIDCNTSEIKCMMEKLIDEIIDLMERMGGKALPHPELSEMINADKSENLLEVIVCDGTSEVALEERIKNALKQQERTWVLPLMPSPPAGSPNTLPPDLMKQNIAFWQLDSIEELALTVLARAGVTSLDRRVFISYRRNETESMANQIFDALTELNFSVFLDTVSIDPGVEFQARLFEQIADKSMIVLLHSENFSQSPWTTAEVNYAINNDISVLIFRLPNVPKSNVIYGCRAGDQILLKETDIEKDEQGKTYRFTDKALDDVLKNVVMTHDMEMISRLTSMRQRTVEALNRKKVDFLQSSHDFSLIAKCISTGKTYSFLPASRPPGITDIFEASTRITDDIGDSRIVVGRCSCINDERIQQMEWVVEGRNVAFCDIFMLDTLLDRINQGVL
jgi:hypothetical protein